MGKSEKIRPVGYLKITKGNKTHIPNLIRRETNSKPGSKIPYVINARSVVLYDSNLSANELIDSLDVMKQDIKLRMLKQEPKKLLDEGSSDE